MVSAVNTPTNTVMDNIDPHISNTINRVNTLCSYVIIVITTIMYSTIGIGSRLGVVFVSRQGDCLRELKIINSMYMSYVG